MSMSRIFKVQESINKLKDINVYIWCEHFRFVPNACMWNHFALFFIFISLPMETFWTIIYTSEKYNCSKLIKLIADEIR